MSQKTVINEFIDKLLDCENTDKFKCLKILLNHDPNLHIIYFIKIFMLYSPESILLFELLFLYEISENIYDNLKQLYSLRDKYVIANIFNFRTARIDKRFVDFRTA